MTVHLPKRCRLPALAAAFTALFLVWPIFMVGDNAEGATPRTQPRKSGSLYAQAVLADRPAAYWRLGEKPGASVAADATGHKHSGHYHNHPRLGLPGAILHDKDTALGLEGPRTKSYVEIPRNDVFSVAKSGRGLTVEVWMKPSVLNFKGENKDPKNPYIHWLGKGTKNAFEWGFRFYSQKSDRPNRISAYIWNRNGAKGSGAYFEERLSTTKWIHIVATYDDPRNPNARVRIYKDGLPSKHNSSPGTLYKTFKIHPEMGTAPVRFGTRDLNGFLTGELDEVAIYPYVLSPKQIQHHWFVGNAIVHEPGPGVAPKRR